MLCLSEGWVLVQHRYCELRREQEKRAHRACNHLGTKTTIHPTINVYVAASHESVAGESVSNSL